LTGTLYRTLYGAPAPDFRFTDWAGADSLLSKLPVIGAGLFGPTARDIATYLLGRSCGCGCYKTHGGLALRAVGENPVAAEAAGIRVNRVRFGAMVFGGVTGGLAGGTLVSHRRGRFAVIHSRPARFIAIAIVVLRFDGITSASRARRSSLRGKRAPVSASAALGLALAYQLFLALPYSSHSGAGRAPWGPRCDPPAR